MSLSAKVTIFVVVQAASTLLGLAGYYMWLGRDTRAYDAIVSLVVEDARVMHRRMDDGPVFGESGRADVARFTTRMDQVTAVLSKGGTFEGRECKRIPVEIRPLLDDVVSHWRRTWPGLMKLATASSDETETIARTESHKTYPYWQAAVARMEKALTQRKAMIHEQMSSALALVGGVDVLFCGALLVLVRRFIRTPIRAAQSAAMRVASGDYSGHVPVLSSDEVGSLAAEFNRMSDTLRDRTQALGRANRELQQYAYAVAHDMQEPARVVSIYTQLLKRRFVLPADASEIADQIQSSAERMRRLVADLFTHSKAVHEPAESVATDTTTAVFQARDFLQHILDETQATVRIDTLPAVHAAAGDLELVFRNLLSNALKYSGNKAPIVDVSGSADERFCVITVRDQGIGIPAEYHERIFGLFKRLHGHAVPGTGVGLAIARTLIEKHGGRIWVESEPGHGAAFRIQLRIAEKNGGAVAAQIGYDA